MKTNNGQWHKCLLNLNKICTSVNHDVLHVNFPFKPHLNLFLSHKGNEYSSLLAIILDANNTWKYNKVLSE